MRRAVLVANDQYSDDRLVRLSAPRHDVVALEDVLGDPELGAFDSVELIYNETSDRVAERLERFLLVESDPADVVLVYFSGHGVLDARDRLCFATSNTNLDQLRSTAVPATLLHQMLDEGPRQQLIVLDCCYSGSFVAGQVPKGDQVHLSAQLGPNEESGRGRTILTATNRFQYALEDSADPDQETSLYTGVLLEGLRSGAADTDADGVITADELHDFAVERLRASGHKQMPHRWALGTTGRFVVARAGSELPEAATRAAPAPVMPSGRGRGVVLASVAAALLLGVGLWWAAARGDGGTGEAGGGGGDEVAARSAAIAALVTDNLAALDARLLSTDTALADTAFDAELAAARDEVAPAAADTFAAGYDALLLGQQREAVRNTISDEELVGIGDDLRQQVLVDGVVDPDDLTSMLVHFEEVDRRYDSLLLALDAPSLRACDTPTELTIADQELAVALDGVEAQSSMAYGAALVVLAQLSDLDDVNARIGAWTVLTPRSLASVDDARSLMAEAAAALERVEAGRLDLVAAKEAAADGDVECLEDMNDELVVRSTDDWEAVVAKAVSLRQLGRVDESVEAFATYGEMFRAEDPTALRYAEVAQDFTRQAAELGEYEGGTYVFSVAAQPAGGALAEGDIIVEIDGARSWGLPAYRAAVADVVARGEGEVDLVVLRHGADAFSTLEVTAPIVDGVLGLGIMPV